MFWYGDPTYLLLIPGLLLALYAQMKVSVTFAHYQRTTSRTGMTGAQAARRILEENGCADVRIEHVRGSLTDHFDPENGVLRLSDEVYASQSIAALGVAAHEAGHAHPRQPRAAGEYRIEGGGTAVHAGSDFFMGAAAENRHPLLFARGAVLSGDVAGGV